MARDLYEKAEELVRKLSARGYTLATAESLTAGMIASTVASIPGASAVLRGGLIVYATDLKGSLTGVDSLLLEKRGPIDPEVALQLARGARQRCAADIGVGVTGVAGPDPQDGHPVGEIYCAISLSLLPEASSSFRRAEGKEIIEECFSLEDRLQHPHGGGGEENTPYLCRQYLREQTVEASFSLILDLLSSISSENSETGNNESQ